MFVFLIYPLPDLPPLGEGVECSLPHKAGRERGYEDLKGYMEGRNG